jgi:hypothetical protein
MTLGLSMRTNLIVCLLAAGFSKHRKALSWRSVIASKERLTSEYEAPANEGVLGPDAYKVAVMVFVGAAVLSVCL